MTPAIERLNAICAALGAPAGHTFQIDALNAWAEIDGGAGGHVFSIDALNEIAANRGAPAGHLFKLDALNAIADDLGAGGEYDDQEDALSFIAENIEPIAPAYTKWTGPGWFDASDVSTFTLSGSQVTALSNKRTSGGNLTRAGNAANITRVAVAQNGLGAIRIARDTSNPPRLEASAAAALSAMFQGLNKPCTIVAAYKPTDTNTSYVWSASDTVDSTDSHRFALIRRSTSASVRKTVATAALNDVTWGSGQASGTARVVAVKHTGTAVTVWDRSTTKAVNGSAQSVAALNSQLVFRLFASEINGGADPTIDAVQGAMDFFEIVIEDTARADADIVQAIEDIAEKWGISLT